MIPTCFRKVGANVLKDETLQAESKLYRKIIVLLESIINSGIFFSDIIIIISNIC